MTGDVSHDDDAEALVASRIRAYAEPAPVPRVPSPHLALDADDRRSTRLGTFAFWCGYALAMGHLAWASDTDHPVSGLATLLFLVGFVGLPVVMWRVRRRAQVVDVRPELARPWLDVLDGLRLGAVEPANPASRVALARVGEVRRLVARDLRRIDQRIAPAPHVVAAVQDAGARTWAASEAWRRAQARLPQGRGHSPLAWLPARLGPSAVEASAHSDAAAERRPRRSALVPGTSTSRRTRDGVPRCTAGPAVTASASWIPPSRWRWGALGCTARVDGSRWQPSSSSPPP